MMQRRGHERSNQSWDGIPWQPSKNSTTLLLWNTKIIGPFESFLCMKLFWGYCSMVQKSMDLSLLLSKGVLILRHTYLNLLVWGDGLLPLHCPAKKKHDPIFCKGNGKCIAFHRFFGYISYIQKLGRKDQKIPLMVQKSDESFPPFGWCASNPGP